MATTTPVSHDDHSTLAMLRELRQELQERLNANCKLRTRTRTTEGYRKIERRIKRWARHLAALDVAIHTESNLSGEHGT